MPEDAASCPPLLYHPEELEGATIDLAVGSSMVIAVEHDPGGWWAHVGDQQMLESVRGEWRDGVAFNPGLVALAPGRTKVTLHDRAGRLTCFTVVVR
ncbi:hypothetical protein [Aeromicrobium erythreum]|uniref:Uncharacterized protein n=1 Tax=Aeromicrobium erythreum TaxID=2041 RepID=A0A0U4C7Z1_9ACTN|nr:hypothetical protein [Aeromicrobium erythreum]ALX04299.1 hypothetical protein AERYTH_06120 [Aeromicrobium erythreum]